LNGMVEKWDLDGANGPTREVMVAARPHPWCIVIRCIVIWCQRHRVISCRYCIWNLQGCSWWTQDGAEDHALFLGSNQWTTPHAYPPRICPGFDVTVYIYLLPWWYMHLIFLCNYVFGEVWEHTIWKEGNLSVLFLSVMLKNWGADISHLRFGSLRICNGQENVNLEACISVEDTVERCHYMSF
jgi:hypothetical protein